MEIKGITCVQCERPCRKAWTGIAWCESCGIFFRHPFPSEDDLNALYENSWVHPEQHRRETGSTNATLSELYIERLEKKIGRALSDLRLLDYGAGRGDFALGLVARGADVVAVEPYAVEPLRSRGLSAYANLESAPGKFDGVIAIEVIEHLTSPLVVMKQIRSLLNPGGFLYISTPNAHGLNARITRSGWREFNKPGHVILFTAAGLVRMLQSAEYERVERLRWFIPGDSVLGSMKNYVLQAGRIDGGLRFLAFVEGQLEST